jgi:hypothetical protein
LWRKGEERNGCIKRNSWKGSFILYSIYYSNEVDADGKLQHIVAYLLKSKNCGAREMAVASERFWNNMRF